MAEKVKAPAEKPGILESITIFRMNSAAEKGDLLKVAKIGSKTDSPVVAKNAVSILALGGRWDLAGSVGLSELPGVGEFTADLAAEQEKWDIIEQLVKRATVAKAGKHAIDLAVEKGMWGIVMEAGPYCSLVEVGHYAEKQLEKLTPKDVEKAAKVKDWETLTLMGQYAPAEAGIRAADLAADAGKWEIVGYIAEYGADTARVHARKRLEARWKG